MNGAVLREAAERPAWRLSFQHLAVAALVLAAVAFLGGRYIYTRYGGYRPLALAHVPPTMLYRARVSLSDPVRAPLVAPIFAALDPRGTRLPALERKLGVSAQDVGRELAFGAGPRPSDFVVVLGVQLPGAVATGPVEALCEVLAEDGIRVEPNDTGCRLSDGAVVARTPDGAVVLASGGELVKDFLRVPELGDRLGFAGPSARGTAPDVEQLEPEAKRLGELLQARYP